MAVDPELLAEAQRRGLVAAPAAPAAPAPQGVDPELLAEARRRGLAPTPAAAPAPTVKDRLLRAARATNDALPTAGMMIGGTLGGTAGAAAGGVGAVPGAVAGAGIGAAGGRGLQRVGQYLLGDRDPANDTALGNAGDIARSGLGGIAAEAVGQGAGAGLAALRPAANKVGAGLAKIATGVPEKYGEAVFKNPDILTRAHSLDTMGKAYDAFQRYTGLKGLEETLVARNRATVGSSQLEKMVLTAANKVAQGAEVDPQELYLASQAASRLNMAAKYGEPQAQMAAASGAIKQGKSLVDDALEKVYPEYASLRSGMFEGKARDAFSKFLPLNKGGTTNVLRPYAVAAEVARKGLVATPALPVVSPAAWGTGIRAANAVSPAAKLLARFGVRKKVEDVVADTNP